MLLEDDRKRLKPATHVGMWLAQPRVDLVAIADSDPAKLDRARTLAPGATLYADAQTLLAEHRPDIVSIATWKDTHLEMLELALANGVRAIVCEKPIAERSEDARAVVDAIAAAGAHLFVNHRRRFDAVVHVLRNEIASGAYGQILQASGYYVYGLTTTGTHLVDTLRFLLLEHAGEVVWAAGHPNELPHFHPPGDPCVDGFVGFENGLKASLQSGDMKAYDLFDVELYGTKGKAVLKAIGREVEIHRVVPSPEHEGFTELESLAGERRGGRPRDQFGFLAEHVLDCLEGRAVSISTGEDALRALEILQAVERSANEDGRRIRVEGARVGD
jgi:predicted dehydrogenase